MEVFTKRLRDTREDKDLTQREVAEMLGIKQEQYQRYESGKNEMPMQYIKKFCQKLNVSADYLLDLSGKRSL